MAKNNEATSNEAAETATAEATAAPEAPKADGRIIKIKVPATATHPYTTESFAEALKGSTVEQSRAEFIREYALTGKYTRAELTVFTRLASGLAADDKALKYQIIFQATKGVDKSVWPVKAEAPKTEAAAEPATAEA